MRPFRWEAGLDRLRVNLTWVRPGPKFPPCPVQDIASDFTAASCSQASSPGLAFIRFPQSSGSPKKQFSRSAGADRFLRIRAMHIEQASRARPPIALIDIEAEVLSNLASASLGKSAMGAELLLQELERAETYDRSCLPPHIVTMMSHVVFVDEGSGEKHEVQLVYPRDADSERKRVSVLTPIGAALIGMPRGAWIDWPNRAVDYRRLRILDVVQPQAAA